MLRPRFPKRATVRLPSRSYRRASRCRPVACLLASAAILLAWAAWASLQADASDGELRSHPAVENDRAPPLAPPTRHVHVVVITGLHAASVRSVASVLGRLGMPLTNADEGPAKRQLGQRRASCVLGECLSASDEDDRRLVETILKTTGSVDFQCRDATDAPGVDCAPWVRSLTAGQAAGRVRALAGRLLRRQVVQGRRRSDGRPDVVLGLTSPRAIMMLPAFRHAVHASLSIGDGIHNDDDFPDGIKVSVSVEILHIVRDGRFVVMHEHSGRSTQHRQAWTLLPLLLDQVGPNRHANASSLSVLQHDQPWRCAFLAQQDGTPVIGKRASSSRAAAIQAKMAECTVEHERQLRCAQFWSRIVSQVVALSSSSHVSMSRVRLEALLDAHVPVPIRRLAQWMSPTDRIVDAREAKALLRSIIVAPDADADADTGQGVDAVPLPLSRIEASQDVRLRPGWFYRQLEMILAHPIKGRGGEDGAKGDHAMQMATTTVMSALGYAPQSLKSAALAVAARYRRREQQRADGDDDGRSASAGRRAADVRERPRVDLDIDAGRRFGETLQGQEEAADAENAAEKNEAPPYFFRLPGVLILGAQKSSTGEMANWLAQHPAVKRRQGEEHFFDCVASSVSPQTEEDNAGGRQVPAPAVCKNRVWSGLPLPLAWSLYARDFHLRPYESHCKVTLEKTPSYLDRADPLDVLALLPSAKLIVMLRDPAARVYSAYWHRCRGLRQSDAAQQQRRHRPHAQAARQLALDQRRAFQSEEGHGKQQRSLLGRSGGGDDVPAQCSVAHFEWLLERTLPALREAAAMEPEKEGDQNTFMPTDDWDAVLRPLLTDQYAKQGQGTGDSTKVPEWLGWARHLSRAIRLSQYASHLRRWLAALEYVSSAPDMAGGGGSQKQQQEEGEEEEGAAAPALLIVWSSELKSAPFKAMRRTLRFIGLPPFDYNSIARRGPTGAYVVSKYSKSIIESRYPEMPPHVRTLLNAHYAPWNVRLRALLARYPGLLTDRGVTGTSVHGAASDSTSKDGYRRQRNNLPSWIREGG